MLKAGNISKQISHLSEQLRRLKVKKKPLIDLLSYPQYSPNRVREDLQINLHHLKANRQALSSLLQRTARDIERLILPFPKGMVRGLIPIVDVERLVQDLRLMADQIKRNPHSKHPYPAVLSDMLDQLSPRRRGRSSVTSARDQRIWDVCSLINEASGAPHYALVAEIVNAVYGYSLDDFEVKKIVSRHPNERTFYPKELLHAFPKRIVKAEKSKFPHKVILYGPPGKIVPIEPNQT